MKGEKNMNKLFTKIVGAALGLTMAIGVGVAVGSNSKEATPVHAAPAVSYDLDLSQASALSSRTPTGSYSYTTVYTLTMASGSRVFTAYGFNPNNYAVAGTRFGNKNSGTTMDNLTNGPTTGSNYVQYISTNATISDSITKVEITTLADFGTCTKGTGYVQVSANSNFSSSTNYSFTHAANSTIPVTISSPAANRYYRVVWQKASSSSNAGIIVSHIKFYYEASTPLTGITLSGSEVGGTSPNYTLANIAKSDTSTNHTVSVGLTPTTATDPKVKVEHYDGDSVVDVYSSPVTCTSGTGSFNVRAKGTAVGTERLKIYGNTETSVVRYLSVTVYDDSVTNWTVSFDSDGGATIADMTVEDGETFEFPSPGTKTHYSFDGWSSDGGNTLYDAGEESPAVDDDIEYTAYWTQDAQTTVIYKSGDGTGSDISSTEYAGSYSLASFPGTWTAPSGKVFSKWSDGSSQYSAGANYTLVGNTTVTFTAVYKAVDEYTLFSGDLVEGDYVICSGTKAMKNETTSSPRIDVADVTVTNNKIVDPDASIIWHIAKDGDYWTIYNAAVEKYAAFTGTNGRGTLIASVTDYARFSTDGSYEFINVGNSGKYLRYNPTYGFASYTTSTGVSLTLYKAPSNELSSIALSGDYKTSFPSGETFSFGGTVTASYTLNDPVNVTSSTTFHLDSADGTNMSGVTMTHAAHDGHTIYAKYTEGGITKTATYEISVANAPVSSVTITTHAAEVGFKEDYLITGITPTVLPADAVQTTEWVVSANTVSNDYTWNGTKLTSGETEGTITLRCRSTADNSKYDELVVTVTGDPTAEFTPASVSGYVGKSDDIAFTYGNMSDTSLISITSGNSSIAEVDEFVADEGEGLVTVNFVAAGSTTLSISYDGGSTLDSITVTVSTDSVTALTWSAPTIKVYSGATTTVSDASSWNVHYTMASGDYGSLVYGEYTLKLGGSSITLPHTWDASEDGKVLSIEYGGFVSPTTSTVDVTQSLQAVNKPNEGDSYYQLVSTNADLEAGRYLIVSIEDAKAFDGSLNTLDAGQNNFDVTISDGTVIANDSTASGKYFDLTVENDAWTITSASGANVGHSASGNGMNGTGTNTITVSNGISTILGTGGKGLAYNSASGSSSERFRYYTSPAANANHSVSLFKLVTEEGEGSTNIANVAGHEAAQKAVVAFAKAMNAAFDNTANCTDGVAAAWTTASNAYSSNITNNASLSADEKAYAKNLIKYASAQYTDDTDDDYSYCLERAMATYEACIQKHGQTAFMSDVRSVSASSRITSLSFINGNGNTVAIIVIISMISVTAIGGYFFLRKRKED